MKLWIIIKNNWLNNLLSTQQSNACIQRIIFTFTLTIIALKSNDSQSMTSEFNTVMYLLMGSICTSSLILRWELPLCFHKRQTMKQMSGWEQHDFKYNKCTYWKQLAYVICLLEKKHCNIKTNKNQKVNKNRKNVQRCNDEDDL